MYEAGLLGRDEQLRVLQELMGRLPDAGGAMTLQGGPGVGKSALLRAAAERARRAGWQLLEVAGRSDDTPFSGLRALLRPVLGTADALPAGQGEILRSVFEIGSGPPPETSKVALAVFNLITTRAAEQPVVLIADDGQWLDRPTRDVLAFMGRRVSDNPIVILGARRSGRNMPDVPVLDVPVLDVPSARRLLARHAATLPPAVRERILGEALGNPLALVELPAAWRPTGLPGSWTHLPVSSALATAFAAGLGELPVQARDALLVAAVEHVGDLSEILAAASVLAGRAVAVDVLDSAVAASLIRLDRTRLRFLHPVVRFAVLEAETPARRQAANAAMARVLAEQPDRRTWHRAQSVNGPDDEIADELADAHAPLLRRHGVVAAIWALERSAQLTADSATRGHRFLCAAEHAYGLGRTRLTHSLIDEAERQELSDADRAKAWLLRDISDADPQPGPARTQVRDITELSAGDPDLALDLLLSAALRAHRTGAGPAPRAGIVAAAERLTGTSDPRHIAALALAEPVLHGRAVADRLPSNERVWYLPDADGLRLFGMAAHAIGDPVRAVDLLGRAEPILREQGRLGLLSETLLTEAADLLLLGDWPRAAHLTEEARRILAETRQPALVAALTGTDAVAAALRGQVERAVELADTVATWQRADLIPTLRLARGVARLGEGRYAEAYEELRPLLEQPHEGLRWQGFAAVMPFAMAADRGSSRHEAAHILAILEEAAGVTPAPLLHVQLPYARAVLAADAAAEELYMVALGQDLARWPLVKARTEHAYGQWLRRRRQAARSRAMLLSARTAFELIGASNWAGRNAAQAAGNPLPSVMELLSPQETLIARLAAEGLANREIAERLHLSHRTVAAHLYRAFPKLGITSRSELAPLLKLPEPAANDH
ncbi:LuxR family transcriptional regulator [Streptomyces sp. NBC_01136]|uniref:AAA family ATPase n=1 Tax=unclassified Streptomyces TaxID=2593676 RepID=UPI003247B7BA|nr:LuxR family transcriptional regulator [Streptomyces sp. NBC_01136]